MKLVLKAKSQSTVVDTENSVDLYVNDAMTLVVWRGKSAKQQVTTEGKPVG